MKSELCGTFKALKNMKKIREVLTQAAERCFYSFGDSSPSMRDCQMTCGLKLVVTVQYSGFESSAHMQIEKTEANEETASTK